MKAKNRKLLILIILLLLIAIFILYPHKSKIISYQSNFEEIKKIIAANTTSQSQEIVNNYQQQQKAKQEQEEKSKKEAEAAKSKQKEEKATTTPKNDLQPTIINGILIVNKQYGIPRNYAKGPNQEAVKQLNALIADAQAQGLNISNNVSGYRTYDYQKKLFDNYCAKDGYDAAVRYSAKPGHSEHETGLAFDLIDNQGQLVQSEKEAIWIKNNCAKYGFIVRYPEGKENITGYIYEPWHLRYVGVDHATKIMNQQTTLEQYLGVA